MGNNEFKKDNQEITSYLAGAKVDHTESVLKPKKQSIIYKIIAYILIVVVLIIFGVLVAKSVLNK